MESSWEAARFEVRGRVQGVGFRFYVWRTARSLGLRGWVRNLPDGTVEVAAAGSPAALRHLEQHLGAGPAQAHVEQVARSPWSGDPNLAEFTIVHEVRG